MRAVNVVANVQRELEVALPARPFKIGPIFARVRL
jgi:hypothetical protein